MKRTCVAGLVVLLSALPVAADDAAKTPWSGSLGLSLLATTGNSDTDSLGVEFGLKRVPDPGGSRSGPSTSARPRTASRTPSGTLRACAARGPWTTAGRVRRGEWGADTFAGFDLRGILEGGATYKLLTGTVHALAVDGGLTWTKLNPVSGSNRSFVGGIVGAAYQWTLSKTSAFTEQLRLYPDFDRTNDWRATSRPL